MLWFLVKNAVDRHGVIMRFALMQGKFGGTSQRGHIHPEETASCCGKAKLSLEEEVTFLFRIDLNCFKR